MAHGIIWHHTCLMQQNRVKQLRLKHGWTVEALAEKVGHTHGHISRIENGKRGLKQEMAKKMADVFNVSVAEVMGLTVGDPEQPPFGLSEDAAPFESAGEEGRAPVPKMGPNTDPWIVKTNVLSNLGIKPGSVIYVDISSDAVENIKPLQCVVAQIYDDEELTKATTIIRQFVPPSLLITNSAEANDRIRDIEKGEAVIKGVVVGHYQPLTS